MPITKATREQIEKNIASSLWDTDMLDRRGLITTLNTDDGSDPFASGSWYNPDRNGSGDGSRSLRAFINSADGRAELAKTDPAVAVELREEQSETVAEEFIQSTPDYYPDPDYRNYNSLVNELARTHLNRMRMGADDAQIQLFDRGFWTVPHLAAAFGRLWDTGMMIPNPGAWKKQLSEDELNKVVAMVRFNDTGRAVVQFIAFALGQEFNRREYASPEDLLVSYPELARQAAIFCWSTLRVIPDDELNDFLPSIRAVKIPSIDVLDKLWARWENKRLIKVFDDEAEAAQPTVEGFEDLSDEEVRQLMNQSILARNNRR
jgi:hypothetical protein